MKEILYSPSVIIKIIIVVTLLFAIISLKIKSEIHKHLFAILTLNFFTELLNTILRLNDFPIKTVTSISIFFHQIIWFLILLRIFKNKKLISNCLLIFIFFGILNFIAIEKPFNFNYYTFVFGALIYVLLFNYESFNQLRKENFSFFKSNYFILVFSPVLYFLGMSLMFAFKSYSLTSTYIIGNLKLYNFVNIFVNLIYYLLLCYYIYKVQLNERHT